MDGATGYDVLLRRAGVHLLAAWDGFQADSLIPWKQMTGNVPREQVRVWVDALKKEVERFEQLERSHSR